jgi:diguanylate cyclase (GGDEF)-like protein
MTDASISTAAHPRVLVVDDDPLVQLLVHEALARTGMRIEEAGEGRQAIESVRRAPPDLVILDIELPDLDGLETCRAMRELPGGRELPVMILTAHSDSETIDRAFEVGATDFINKPIDLQLLQHRVRFLMRAHSAFSDLTRTLSDLRSSEKRLANAQRLARVGSWEWVPDTEEMLWSEEVYRIFKIPQRAGSSTYEAFLDVVHPEDRPVLEKAMRQAACEARPWVLDHRIALAGGEERVVRQQAEIVPGPSGAPACISGTIQDITDRHRAKEQIRHLVYYDGLTSLPNRKMLSEELERILRRARTNNEGVALLFLDLDRFSRINDTLGYAVGDELLKAVADRLINSVRGTDYVGRPETPHSASVSRLGGDEFTVVLPQVTSSETAAQVARRVLETVRAPFAVEGHRLDVTASIGIALFPNDGSDPDTLLRSADAATYHAKELGCDLFQFFSESMNERAMRDMRLESGLRTGIERGELTLHYQPQFDARTGRIVAAEALVRWRSPDYGLIPPNDFIPLAEESGLIVPLGEWVLRTACGQTRVWREAGLPEIRIAVNVSSHQVQKGGLQETVERALRHARLDASLLEIEITESALIDDAPEVLETLSGLRSMGVRLALDDFGTGYSSLSHLVRFPFDTLKIDRCFVNEIGAEGQGNAIIAAVVAMAQRLQLTVTAEGVETPEQREFLRIEGCDLLQGFLTGRPVEADALEALLRQEPTRCAPPGA